ncbi:MAG: glycosyl transferase family 2 [Rhodocyclales bacterium]|nr:glycosyl transferase family 2 [Rhodocyclales bacterium]
MKNMPKICIVVPAYNEEANIASVIGSLKTCNPEFTVVVVNDGSSDRTGRVAESTNQAVVLNLPCNLGIGGGVQTGFRFAAQNGFDIAVQFDGDGQHIAEEIQKILSPILGGTADVVIGSRFIDHGQAGFKSTGMRRIGIRIFSILNSIIVKQKITDNTSGFRAYNREAFCMLARYYSADYPEPEAVILLGKNGFRMQEVAVEMRARQGGTSSIHGLKSAYYMFKVITSILITAIRPLVKRETLK